MDDTTQTNQLQHKAAGYMTTEKRAKKERDFQKYRFLYSTLDTLRENCAGIIRKQASTDGGVMWEVVRVNVVQVRR
ncbi:hypothetical protein TNCV_483931 [Trichonephila clavipes]|nr:hypothetical protein TNCV_483931 [Trichonephila clavipes]